MPATPKKEVEAEVVKDGDAAKSAKEGTVTQQPEATEAKAPGEAPQHIGGHTEQPMTAAELAKSAKEGTVTMIFPTSLRLTLDNSRVVLFPAGTQEVPKEYADHWWLKANKVKVYGE